MENGNKNKLISILKTTTLTFLLSIAIVGCTSTTVISSNPTGASLYIDGMNVGKTPYTYKDSKIVGSSTSLKLKKEGYDDLHIMLNKSEQADVGAIIGGILVGVPFLWIMEYYPTHEYELEKLEK